MTPRESRTITVGQRICWVGSTRHLGLIVANDWSGVEIGWDSGHCEYRHHANTGDIGLAELAARPTTPAIETPAIDMGSGSLQSRRDTGE